MKRIESLVIFILLSNCEICFSQSNDEIAQKSVEIVQWINSFEDSNSPERIMQGTLQDKVHASYDQGILTIYSMIWQGSRDPIITIKEIIKIKEIVRIEAKEKVMDDYIIADIAIFVKEGSISLECKNDNEANFHKCGFENKWFDHVGFCSKNLRFKFPKDSAKAQIERVLKALSDLTVLNGGSPKIGSLY